MKAQQSELRSGEPCFNDICHYGYVEQTSVNVKG